MVMLENQSTSITKQRLIKGSWKDFRAEVVNVLPELARIIDDINPGPKYSLYKMSYLYGEQITNQGTVCLPDSKGVLKTIDDENISQELKENFGYAPTPLILQLSKSSEVFVDTKRRIIPLNIFKPGDLFGLFETLVPYTGSPIFPCWNVTAGARTVFVVPKVTDNIGNGRLKKEFNIDPDCALKLQDHWHIFKKIISNVGTQSPWTSEILIFSKEWFEDRNDSIEWLRFQKFLFKKAWIQSKNTRSKTEYSTLWESFASEVTNKNFKPSAYLINTIMHVLFIANGAIPGFRAVTDTREILLPHMVIEKAYNDIYGKLKDYAPLLLAPGTLKSVDDNPVYYSFYFPTLLEGAFLKEDDGKSTMQTIRQIMPLMSMLDNVLSKKRGGLYAFIKNTEYNYFHSKQDQYKEIHPTDKLVESDKLFQVFMQNHPDQIFPNQGQFFKGCCQLRRLE